MTTSCPTACPHGQVLEFVFWVMLPKLLSSLYIGTWPHLNKWVSLMAFFRHQGIFNSPPPSAVHMLAHLVSIGSDNGLSPGRSQAIIWTNAGILLTGSLGTNSSEILIEIHTFLFKKIHLKLLSGKCWPFCLGLNVLSLMAFSRHQGPFEPCNGKTSATTNMTWLVWVSLACSSYVHSNKKKSHVAPCVQENRM